MPSRTVRIWTSFRSVPLWVQVWIMVLLFPLNAASLGLTHWNTGYWAAWAFAFVALTNIPMTIAQAGLSRLLALPHVVAWGPLQVYLLLRLAGSVGGPLQPGEWAYATALAIINAISLTFDVWDSWRWLRGERAVHGSVDLQVSAKH